VSGFSVGVDLVEIERLERALERRPRLAERLFSAAEQEYAAGHRRPATPLAARFAAKEATVKALGIRGANLREIEVLPGPPPVLALTGRVEAAAEERSVELALSLSHERGHAVAVVLATPR
jgi:holo-[acyl-carrier protein] synthase